MKKINLLLSPFLIWISIHCPNAQEVCNKLAILSKEEADGAKIIRNSDLSHGYTIFYDDKNLDDLHWDQVIKLFELKEQK